MTHDTDHPRVLVTRPEPENSSLCHELTAQAWHPTALPLVSFSANHPLPLPGAVSPYCIIAISPRAVHFGLDWLKRNHKELFKKTAGHPPYWVAIGPATKRALEKANIAVHNTPCKSQNSEQLISTPFFKSLPPSCHILVLKGCGGRTVIQSTLTEQGHNVHCLDVYKRTLPSYTVHQLYAAQLTAMDCFTVTSSEILHALVKLLSNVDQMLANDLEHDKQSGVSQPKTPRSASSWLDTPLFVVGQRQAQDAKKFGFNNVYMAPGADNQTLIQTLNHWRATRPDHAK